MTLKFNHWAIFFLVIDRWLLDGKVTVIKLTSNIMCQCHINLDLLILQDPGNANKKTVFFHDSLVGWIIEELAWS